MSTPPRIFITGVSGYLGGNLVGRLVDKHPEWHHVVLIRNEDQKEIVLARWPQLEVVIGDLNNSALMIEEGAKANVVLRKYSIFETQEKFADASCRSRICRPHSRCHGTYPRIE